MPQYERRDKQHVHVESWISEEKVCRAIIRDSLYSDGRSKAHYVPCTILSKHCPMITLSSV
eukprot:scaffold1628_cov407-Prasinococcus_capsulatus_cf.AAC.1